MLHKDTPRHVPTGPTYTTSVRTTQAVHYHRYGTYDATLHETLKQRIDANKALESANYTPLFIRITHAIDSREEGKRFISTRCDYTYTTHERSECKYYGGDKCMQVAYCHTCKQLLWSHK